MTFTIDKERSVRIGCGLIGLIVAASTGLAGCGNSDSLPVLKVYNVNGSVVLADGQPLNGGKVFFVSKTGDLAVTPSGVIGPDGTFSLVTGGSGEGAPPGEYKLRIEASPLATAATAREPLFPIRYTDEDSSGLLVTVRAEANQLGAISLK